MSFKNFSVSQDATNDSKADDKAKAGPVQQTDAKKAPVVVVPPAKP